MLPWIGSFRILRRICILGLSFFHYYDGSLEWLVSAVNRYASPFYPVDVRFGCLARMITKNLEALEVLDQLSKSCDPANQDIKNKVSTVSILDCLERCSDLIDADLLIEQLLDMKYSGFCPQGRCVRLLQIFLTLTD